MADPIGTFSGLSSGIQWRDMVDQIMALESKRYVDPLTRRQTSLNNAASAWTEFQTVAAKFRDAAQAVRDATAFSTFSTTASKSAPSSRDLVAVSADSTAAPGSYSVQVQQLATAEKLSGAVAATATTALSTTGSFALNGKTVTVVATDTLTSLRDKINALNAGTSPSGVTASILRSGTGARLVLSANQTGTAGIELVDDASSTLTTLGFTDTSVVSNITAAGDTQTNRVSSSTATFATLLGIPLPGPSTIKVGGQPISVDLTIDSLTTIAARINAACSATDAAEVVTETVGSTTYSRLRTRLAVEVNSADATLSARTMAVLGFTKAGRGGIAQVVQSANTFTNASNVAAVDGTLLSDLKAGGLSLGLVAGDVITVTGKRGDGSAVTRTLTVDGASTLQSLFDSANDVVTGFGTPSPPSRTATLDINAGQLQLTDQTLGDSQLGLSITVVKVGGGTISFGNFSTSNVGGTVGRNRQINAGTDARFTVDDQVVIRSTNAISDVVTGVTFNLLAAEEGSSVDVTVSRNFDATVARMQSLASAYNDVRTWADNNTAAGKRLAGNSALKAMVSSLSSALLSPVLGLTGTYSSAATVGVSRDKTGVLAVDATVLKDALTANFDDVRRLFGLSGVPSDPEVSFVSASDLTKASSTPYAVVISQAATTASVTGSAFASYAAGATPDTMTITDAATGRTGTVTLTNGDTIAKVIANLNSAFTTNKLNLVASNSGGAVKILASDYGTAGGFTIAYTPGSANGTALLGITAKSYAGLDVAGTINGIAGTGYGRNLTSATGTDTEGLQFNYLGTTARAAGSIAFSVGVGGMLYSAASSIARDLDGQAVILSASSTSQADGLSSRILDAQDRLARRRATMIAQFIAMESAMNKAQSLSSALTSQINGFSSNK